MYVAAFQLGIWCRAEAAVSDFLLRSRTERSKSHRCADGGFASKVVGFRGSGWEQ